MFTVAQSFGVVQFEASGMQSHVALVTGIDRCVNTAWCSTSSLTTLSSEQCFQCGPPGGPSTQLGGEQVETLLSSCSGESRRVLEHIDLNNLVAERQQVLLLDCSIPIFLAIELKCILDSRVDSEVEYWPIPLLEPVLNHVA